MDRNRRTLISAGAIALAAPAITGLTAARAQAWPDRPIRMIVNFPPGGAVDVIGRALGQELSARLGQNIVVENRPGANGNIGADAAAKSAPDGYTVLMSSGSAFTVNPFLYTQMPFDASRDLVPVASVARVLVYLLTTPALPVNNVAEFVAHAKAHSLSYGSPGIGSSPHLAAEMFARQAGFKATHVPYRGAAPVIPDLISGQVQYTFDPGPGLPHAREGRLKILAVGSPQRSPQWPNVPTVAESGYPGFDADSVFGVYVPGGTPAAVIERLHAEINRAIGTPAVAGALDRIGAIPMALSRDEFIARQRRDSEHFGGFIRSIGLRVE